jgi:hypothetical protein
MAIASPEKCLVKRREVVSMGDYGSRNFSGSDAIVRGRVWGRLDGNSHRQEKVLRIFVRRSARARVVKFGSPGKYRLKDAIVRALYEQL